MYIFWSLLFDCVLLFLYSDLFCLESLFINVPVNLVLLVIYMFHIHLIFFLSHGVKINSYFWDNHFWIKFFQISWLLILHENQRVKSIKNVSHWQFTKFSKQWAPVIKFSCVLLTYVTIIIMNCFKITLF